ncbi:hypothetical protein [Streptomyces sp. NBC_00057]|uniref:hypothetical protein n=1 Tax=Streptomyces sp. NBC_00057 TaxID=2975634 RepID=UPI00324BD25D
MVSTTPRSCGPSLAISAPFVLPREPAKRIDAVAALRAAAVSVVLAGAGFRQGA